MSFLLLVNFHCDGFCSIFCYLTFRLLNSWVWWVHCTHPRGRTEPGLDCKTARCKSRWCQWRTSHSTRLKRDSNFTRGKYCAWILTQLAHGPESLLAVPRVIPWLRGWRHGFGSPGGAILTIKDPLQGISAAFAGWNLSKKKDKIQ